MTGNGNVPELRHYHGVILHDHPGGDVPHDHGPDGQVQPRQIVSAFNVIYAILLALIVLGGLWVIHNELARSNPPAACQLFGGQWSIWSGWRCG